MVFYTNNESKIELNALVVRVRSLPGVKSRHQNIDTVIIRFEKLSVSMILLSLKKNQLTPCHVVTFL